MQKLLIIIIGMVLFFSFGYSTMLENLDIGGFISMGYTKSSQKNIGLKKVLKDFMYSDEVALTLWTSFDSQLNMGLQFMAREFGIEGNNNVNLDWAVIDYQMSDLLGFRVGKIKRLFGFYNHIRDVNTVLPWIEMPSSIYFNEDMRQFFLSVLGGSLYGTIYLPMGMGELSYNTYFGESELKDNVLLDEWINVAGKIKHQDVEILHKSLEWEPKLGYAFLLSDFYVPGFTIGYSFMAGKEVYNATITGLQYNDDDSSSALFQKTEGYIDVPYCNIYSVSYEKGPLTLAGEYSLLNAKMKDTIYSPDVVDQTKEGSYLFAGYQLLDWLKLYSYYGVDYFDKDDKGGNSHKQYGQPSYLAWKKDLALGLQFNINEVFSIKVESHNVDGVGSFMKVHSDTGNGKHESRYWDYLSVKANILF